MPETEQAPPPEKAAEKTAEKSERKEQAPAPRKPGFFANPVRVIILLIVLGVLAVVGFRVLAYLDSYESTDDAQVDGELYPITSRINGTIKNIWVEDNAHVKAGQLLADIDPRDYQVAVEQAQASLHESQAQVSAAQPNVPITSVSTESTVSTSAADLANTRAQVAAAQREYDSDLADVRSAEADSVKAQSDLARYKQLVVKDEISQQQYDQAVAASLAAAANVESKRATAEAAARNIEAAQARVEQAASRQLEAERNRPQQIALQNALVRSRQASTLVQKVELDKAQLNLSYTTIVAPIDGIVGRRSASNGEQVASGQQIMVVVPLEGLWVTANFKETQLKRMHPGQRATIHVDAYDRDYEGYVADLAGASGARFSLLPPENATGNYVKVVQRVPVRINLKQGQNSDRLLREGMSVDPKVWLDPK